MLKIYPVFNFEIAFISIYEYNVQHKDRQREHNHKIYSGSKCQQDWQTLSTFLF